MSKLKPHIEWPRMMVDLSLAPPTIPEKVRWRAHLGFFSSGVFPAPAMERAVVSELEDILYGYISRSRP